MIIKHFAYLDIIADQLFAYRFYIVNNKTICGVLPVGKSQLRGYMLLIRQQQDPYAVFGAKLIIQRISERYLKAEIFLYHSADLFP